MCIYSKAYQAMYPKSLPSHHNFLGNIAKVCAQKPFFAHDIPKCHESPLLQGRTVQVVAAICEELGVSEVRAEDLASKRCG